MKYSIMSLALITVVSSFNVKADDKVFDEASLINAIAAANVDSHIRKIVFKKNSEILLTAPVIYTGTQSIKLLGKGSTIDGSSAGSFTLDEDLTAVSQDGTLIFNTASDINIKGLSIVNSATRGIVINIPENAEDDDIRIVLNKVNIIGSALYGLHIDDNTDEFDDGVSGSSIGIDLKVMKSSFTGNGTGAIDFDGVRVDERADGDITALFVNTHIDGNGGDGIELDEAGNGDVDVIMLHVTLNGNGFYNVDDFDDGFDIDEADKGNIDVFLSDVEVLSNRDEGLDFDEAGKGDVELKFRRIRVVDNSDEGIKVNEEDGGDIEAKMSHVSVHTSGDDGIQLIELGEGKIEISMRKVSSDDNAKYGITLDQWYEKDEVAAVEEAGYAKVRKVVLSGNGKGDDIATNNVDIK